MTYCPGTVPAEGARLVSRETSAHFAQETRAKKGSGPRRGELIRDMRMEERALDHYIIAYGAGRDEKMNAKRREVEENLEKFRVELREITIYTGLRLSKISRIEPHEWKGHSWNDQHHCSKCGQNKDHENHK